MSQSNTLLALAILDRLIARVSAVSGTLRGAHAEGRTISDEELAGIRAGVIADEQALEAEIAAKRAELAAAAAGEDTQ